MGDSSSQLTSQTLKVLLTLMENPRVELSGADIRKNAQLRTGTLYPILMRLEKAGWLESRWEDEDPKSLGRPRRRYYRVTALGAKHSKVEIQNIKAAVGRLVWT